MDIGTLHRVEPRVIVADAEPDDPSVVELLQEKAAAAVGVKLHVFGSMTKQNAGKELAEMGRLSDAGVALFSDDAFPIQNAEVMRRAMEYARQLHRGVALHCEDKSLAADGVMNEGPVSTMLGLKGIPNAAEDVMAPVAIRASMDWEGKMPGASVIAATLAARHESGKALLCKPRQIFHGGEGA